ncbi:MAG: hypothetical protein GEV11_18815 [Streptosporangiales bacterium]|nr:hypothetical protein [Streptosporangiales bacterium]
MSDTSPTNMALIFRQEAARLVEATHRDLKQLRTQRRGEESRAATAERALNTARAAAVALGAVVEHLEQEARAARTAWLDADPSRCDMSGPVCPEHGATVVVTQGRNTCTRPGCELGATVPRADWDHCSAPTVVVITDADGNDELTVCRGHLADARTRLAGLRIVTILTRPHDAGPRGDEGVGR